MNPRKRLLIILAIVCGNPSVHAEPPITAAETLRIESGKLSAMLRDNSQSPKVLSGLDSLVHTMAAPGFDAFDPDDPGASAGLNFEHVIVGHRNHFNAFTPRHGKYELYQLPAVNGAKLVRRAEDDPWKLSSTFTYSFLEPEAVDFEFRCRAQDASLFGERRYAVLFFANYMNDVLEPSLHFRGVTEPNGIEQWISTDAPPGHPDYDHGGTIRSHHTEDLQYDIDHNFKLNLWSYDYPRFTQPFYFGRAANGMVFILMFDRMRSVDDEIRFSLFKFKLPKKSRPAWDFQYVIHRVSEDRPYGFRGRLVWKKFVSPEDCENEYRRWRSQLDKRPSGEQLRVMFHEEFDDAQLPQRDWYDGSKFAIADNTVKVGKGSIEYHWKPDTTTPDSSSGIRHRFEPTDAVYLRFHIRLSKNWRWTGRSYHPHLMHFMTTENSAYHGPAASHLTVYVEPHQGKLRLAAQDIQNKDAPHGLTQGPLRGGFNGKFYDSDEAVLRNETWHLVEALFKLNTLDLRQDRPNSDGVARAWIDGRIVVDRSDVVFRSTDFPEMRFNQFLMLPYFGPGLLPNEQTLWIDELVVAAPELDVSP